MVRKQHQVFQTENKNLQEGDDQEDLQMSTAGGKENSVLVPSTRKIVKNPCQAVKQPHRAPAVLDRD